MKVISSSFVGVSSVFAISLTGVSGKFWVRFKEVSKKFQERFKSVLRRFQGSFKKILRVFQGRLMGVNTTKICFLCLKSKYRSLALIFRDNIVRYTYVYYIFAQVVQYCNS